VPSTVGSSSPGVSIAVAISVGQLSNGGVRSGTLARGRLSVSLLVWFAPLTSTVLFFGVFDIGLFTDEGSFESPPQALRSVRAVKPNAKMVERIGTSVLVMNVGGYCGAMLGGSGNKELQKVLSESDKWRVCEVEHYE
jgi:hypothetical protein